MDASLTIRLSNLGVTEEQSRISEHHVRPHAISDEKLIAQICLENREAMADLFRRYARVVRGVAYRVLRDPYEAEDLLQDIFLLVQRLCRTFDSSKGPARFWILQMTYRRAISRRRYLNSRHFYTRLDLKETAAQVRSGGFTPSCSQVSLVEGIDRKEVLQSCFAKLSRSQRQTLHLFFFEGYTFAEIAEKLGQTTGNARNHYYRGLEKLRKEITAGKLPRNEAE